MAKLSEASTSPKPLGSKLPLSNRSILWIDDNPLNNLYEQNLFKQLGADITLATSTAQALQDLDQNAYDLLISDIHRVENGHGNPSAGYELLDQVRQKKMQTLFVFYTGNIARLDTKRAKLSNGAADGPSALRNLVLDILQP